MLMVLTLCLPANNRAIGEFIAARSPGSFWGPSLKSSIFLAMLTFWDLSSLTSDQTWAPCSRSPGS